MPDLDVLASWLQDRWAEAEEAAEALQASWPGPWMVDEGVYVLDSGGFHLGQCAECGVMAEYDRGVATHIAQYGPAAVLADLASKRALLADLMAEGHEHWCPQCPPALSPDEDCICELGARALRRLRILASPFTGRDDMPEALREETRD